MNFVLEYEKGEIELNHDAEVIVKSGISSKTLELTTKIIGSSEVKSLLHYRDGKKAIYYTILYFENYTVFINSGIASGYVGSGSSAFLELLVYLGIERERAEEIAEVETRKITQGSLKIDFYY